MNRSESRESVVCDAVSLNGMEAQSARRAHMREQTLARQAVERRLAHPRILRGAYDYHARMAELEAEAREELARIEAAHQTWLRARSGGVDEPLSRRLPPDTM